MLLVTLGVMLTVWWLQFYQVMVLTSLVVSDSLSTWQLLQVININMWAYHQVTSEQEHHGHFSKEERLVSGVVASLQAALLSSCLLPVYTMQQGTQLLDYFALPAVRILLEWVQCQPLVLRERGFTTRPQIWPGLARLLNEVRPLIAEFDSSRLKDYPLPEDYDMQAFTPLQTPLARYNMKQVLKGETLDKDSLARLRCARMVNIGMALSRQSPAVISFSEDTNTFEAVDVDWRDVREDPAVLVEEIEMLEDIDSSDVEAYLALVTSYRHLLPPSHYLMVIVKRYIFTIYGTKPGLELQPVMQ